MQGRRSYRAREGKEEEWEQDEEPAVIYQPSWRRGRVALAVGGEWW